MTFLDEITEDPENQRTLSIPPGSLCFVVHRAILRVADEIYITHGVFSSRRLWGAAMGVVSYEGG